MGDPSFNYHAALTDCAQGKPWALQRLYTQEAPCMLALANIMLDDQSAAQDAVHDAFVLIWKNAESYDRSMGSARAWMHSIMRYRTLSLLQRRPAPQSNPVPATLPFRVNETRGLAGVLAQQPDHLRKPILMAFYNGMSYEHMATQLGLTVAEVRDHVCACLLILQERELA